MAREKVKWCENCAMLEKMYLDAKAMHDTQVGDIRALRDEVARLRQRVEELEREAGILTKGITDQHDRAEAAEANLARCVEALDRTLTEAGMQAHKHGCPERLCRPAKWDEHAPCAGCQAEAALAVKGGE